MNLMIIPTLEREKDLIDRRSIALGLILAVLCSVFVTYLPYYDFNVHPPDWFAWLDVRQWVLLYKVGSSTLLSKLVVYL